MILKQEEGQGGTKPKTSIILWDTAQIKDGFAYSQALGIMRNVGRQNKMLEEVNLIDNQILCRIHVRGHESIMSKGEDLLTILNSAVLS